MNANLEPTENGEAVSQARPAIPMWDHNGDSHTFTPTPADTHKNGMETEELPPVKGGADAAPQTFSFPNPRGFEPVFWDGNEATLPLDDAKKMLTLRYQYTYSAYVEPTFKNRAEKTEFLRRSGIIRRVCFAKEQGLPQIEMARLTSERVRHVGREAARKSNQAALEKFVESGDVSTAPISLAGGDEFILGAIMEPSEDGTNLFPGLLVTARERLALYGLLWFGLWPVVNPTERAEEIKLELSAPAALTPDQIIALQNELIGLESEAATLAKTAAVARLNELFGPVREICDVLLAELLSALEKQQANAVAAEKSFFEKYGIQHSATDVSKRFDNVLASVRHQVNAPKTAQHHVIGYVPGPGQTPITNLTGLKIPGIS